MRINRGIARITTPERPTEDIDLENRIANFLHQRKVPAGEYLQADAHLGTVVVSGQLPTRHAKWLCMECCRHVAGVIKLVDNVVVQPDKKVQEEFPRILKWTGKMPVRRRSVGFNRRLASASA